MNDNDEFPSLTIDSVDTYDTLLFNRNTKWVGHAKDLFGVKLHTMRGPIDAIDVEFGPSDLAAVTVVLNTSHFENIPSLTSTNFVIEVIRNIMTYDTMKYGAFTSIHLYTLNLCGGDEVKVRYATHHAKTRDGVLMDLINDCIVNTRGHGDAFDITTPLVNTRGHGDAFDITTPLGKITRNLSKMLEILEDKK
jgi:hypothetical protein